MDQLQYHTPSHTFTSNTLTMAPKAKLPIWQKIVNATAAAATRGERKAPRVKVAKMCGFPKEPTVYMNAMRDLKNKKKYLVYDTEWITLTPEGFEKADLDAEPGSNQDALQAAQEKFASKKQKRILEICFDGRTHSFQEIGELIDHDHKKASFTNLTGPLKTNEYVTYMKDKDGNKALYATDNLFPFGRPTLEG